MRVEIPVLSFEYQLSENREQFLLFDSGHDDDDRILIFATDQIVQFFAFAHRYFSNCISFMLEITAKRFPYFWLRYDRFFSEIRHHVLAAGNKPNTILCDLELAAVNSA